MNWTGAIALISALLGGGALKLIEFFVQRKDNKEEKKILKKIDGLDNKIDKLDWKVDDNYAKQARVRILRFSDELQTGQKFSKGYFNQIFSDISDYKLHCENHKEFKNDQANVEINNIIKVHAELLEKERQGENVFL